MNIIMKYDIVKLVVHLNCNFGVRVSNLGLNKINFLFAKHFLARMSRGIGNLGGSQGGL